MEYLNRSLSLFLNQNIIDTITVQQLLQFLGTFLILFIIFRIFRKVLLKRFEKLAKRTKSDFDDKIVEVVEDISSLFYWYAAFYITTKTSPIIEMPYTKFLDGAFLIIVTYEIIKIIQTLVDYGLTKWNASRRKALDTTSLHVIYMIIRILLWVIGALMVLSNLGFDISALMVGGGIGGIAVALAAQNILGDLFSSFSIYIDRPFQIGDFIVIGNDKGTVKKIGLKTTRLQTLQGEELVISNKELTAARVQNFKKMKKRRASFDIGVTYETPLKKLKKIPEIIEKIINKQDLTECDRVHFKTFGDFSLIYSIVLHIDSSDYAEYANYQQTINFEILEAFEKEGIDMAYPTQTVFINKG